MIFATNNKDKLKELKEIFSDFEIYSLNDKNINIDIVEDMDSFYGNALKKAKEIYSITKEPVLADDSGLCILDLDNFPGVLTHRFLGDVATDLDRNNALIKMTNKLSNRKAQVICVIVYYDGDNVLVGEGTLEGKISTVIKGSNGFGFDPIFELEDGRTLAELSCEEKNRVSARYLALMDIKDKINKYVSNKQLKNK